MCFDTDSLDTGRRTEGFYLLYPRPSRVLHVGWFARVGSGIPADETVAALVQAAMLHVQRLMEQAGDEGRGHLQEVNVNPGSSR